MYRGWQVPLTRPYDYNSAQNMFMLGQSFPGRGKRGVRTSIARSDVDLARDEVEQARLHVHGNVRKAFFDMLHAQDEIRIHDQHVGIAQQAIEAARIKYSVGKIPQVEILKAQLRPYASCRAHDPVRSRCRSGACPPQYANGAAARKLRSKFKATTPSTLRCRLLTHSCRPRCSRAQISRRP